MTVADPASHRLEHAYRRLLRWYPAAYRADREQEMLGTLCEMAQPGQIRPTARERVSLLRGAVRAHVRGAGDGIRGATAAATIPVAALITGYLLAVYALLAFDGMGLTDVVHVGSVWGHLALAVTTALWAGAVVSVLRGHAWWARGLAAGAALAAPFMPGVDAGVGTDAHKAVVIGGLLLLLAPAAALRLDKRERLRAGLVAALVAPVSVAFAVLTVATSVPAHSRRSFAMDLDEQALPIGTALALLVAAGLVFQRTGARGLLTTLLIASATVYLLEPIHDLLPRGSMLAMAVLFGYLPAVALAVVAFTATTMALRHLRRALNRPQGATAA
ncbi:hypothetical protein SK803_06765 [Lentzea sp. BCCO 10_0856]|uniref:Uncharacterized protein n=1 Tax=Lentzea miocenica TaxID=3095431 RepID=A0ABU4SVU7_9PSEU|nr:hypothetical protein [Lentzea sp. BCCO 10_0856]MDX8029907.1 hypothetical protein [Lentzea sp. BCCO 10_0856]